MKYIGTELETFRDALNWKQYLASQVREWIRGDVLEVGAGIGGSSQALCTNAVTSWTSLEPSPDFEKELRRAVGELARAKPSIRAQAAIGTLNDLPSAPSYDTILYIDVLEHIADDRRELAEAALRLKPGGCVIVLSPAHQWLFSDFDAAIGHHRRYDAKSLRALTPAGTERVSERYLDCVGVAASLSNRMLIRSSSPSYRSIQLWDRLMVPMSRWIDPLLGYRLGKTIVMVWQR